MTDDERIERLLRSRPATDAWYEPTLAELLDGRRGETAVVGTLRWRHGNPALGRLVPLALLVAAILVAATAVLIGGPRPERLVVAEPSPSFVPPDPVPNFPSTGVTTILERFRTSHWGTTPNVVVDLAVQRDDSFWVAISDGNLATTLGQGSWPGQTIVRIGGTGHLIVAASVLLLVDQGRIDLETPVSRYLPDWPDGGTITVRNLLDGSSGVAAFGEPLEDLMTLVAAEPGRTWTATDALRIARDKQPRFAVGARHEPVDTEDALLAAMVETETGMTLWDFISPVLFEARPPEPQAVVPDPSIIPVGLIPPVTVGLWDPTRSGTLVELADLPPDVVSVLGSARNIAETVGGLTRLTHQVHSGSTILVGRTRMLLDRTIEEGGFGGVAMCPCSDDTRDGVGLVGHTGPYTALTVYVPSERLTISIVANAPVSDADLQGLLQEIHDLVWPAIGG